MAIYSYDVFNRRVKKEVGGQTYGYAWDGWNQIEDSLNGPNEVRNRRVYGLGLDNALRMDFDLNGSGGPDVQNVPVYDGIGNLVALTNSAGKPIERYEYSAYGKQKIFVDGTPPQINQIRKVGSTFFIEMSEEVSLVEIQRQIAEGHIKLVGTGVGGTYGLTASQPIQEGPLARRRIALTTGATIAASQEVKLTIGAQTLVDSFLNAAPGTANVHTFDWELEGILEDNTAPSVERIAVRSGRIEIDFDETVDATLAAQAITVDGGVVAWTLASSGYRLVADVALTVGSHEVEIGTNAVDLASKGLSVGVEHGVTVGTEGYVLVFQAPNAGEIATSTANNSYGFHGQTRDLESGLLYLRNRYLDVDLGTFISADPVGFIDGPSVYSYAGSDPANKFDPFGLCLGTLKPGESNKCPSSQPFEHLASFFKGLFWSGPKNSAVAPIQTVNDHYDCRSGRSEEACHPIRNAIKAFGERASDPDPGARAEWQGELPFNALLPELIKPVGSGNLRTPATKAPSRLPGRGAAEKSGSHQPSNLARMGQAIPEEFIGDGLSYLTPEVADIPVSQRGGPTTGVLHVPGQEPVLLRSGMQGPSMEVRGQGLPGFNGNQLMHVEGHAAAYMRTNAITEATLDINRVPCVKGSGGGCEGLLPKMLPEGAKLRVRGPDGFNETYTGLPDRVGQKQD